MNWSAEILFYCPDNMRSILVLWQQKDDAILGIAIGVLSAKWFYKNRRERFPLFEANVGIQAALVTHIIKVMK
jgi:bifunctional DNase/RNase